MLWAEGTHFFKIGLTHRSVDERALAIQTSSPFPIRIVAEREGARADEMKIHFMLKNFRAHGEWFLLPEWIAWVALDWFGVDVPAAHGI